MGLRARDGDSGVLQSTQVSAVRRPSSDRHQHEPKQRSRPGRGITEQRGSTVQSEGSGMRKDERFAEGQHYSLLHQGDNDTAQTEHHKHSPGRPSDGHMHPEAALAPRRTGSAPRESQDTWRADAEPRNPGTPASSTDTSNE